MYPFISSWVLHEQREVAVCFFILFAFSMQEANNDFGLHVVERELLHGRHFTHIVADASEPTQRPAVATETARDREPERLGSDIAAQGRPQRMAALGQYEGAAVQG